MIAIIDVVLFAMIILIAYLIYEVNNIKGLQDTVIDKHNRLAEDFVTFEEVIGQEIERIVSIQDGETK
tara:strand:- start:189 stop:392 length:204 start_codon:yes stop_codon:yes gene_type:complete